jgi:hypothetical protein
MSDAPQEPQESLRPEESDTRHELAGQANHNAPDVDMLLEVLLRRALAEQAAHIHFSPELRTHILSRLAARAQRQPRQRLTFVPALGTLLVLMLGLLLIFAALPLLPKTPPTTSILRYEVVQKLAAPPALAHGGRLVAVDPSGRHLVFQPPDQPGVMYTASLDDPTGSQLLAMREAHQAVWSSDGSALVTVVTPPGTAQPLLALVPYGQYMYPLGATALAASWSPLSTNEITYVTQRQGQTLLWATTRSGHPTQLLATMAISLTVEQLAWSPDGRYLALLAAQGFDQPGRAIYLMNHQSGQVVKLVSAGDFSIIDLSWSPDGRFLSYERLGADGRSSLVVIEAASGRQVLVIPMQQALAGWSWSPNGQALIYSDGGRLAVHIFAGPQILLPSSTTPQLFPFWLRDGRLLILQEPPQGASTLALLAPMR